MSTKVPAAVAASVGMLAAAITHAFPMIPRTVLATASAAAPLHFDAADALALSGAARLGGGVLFDAVVELRVDAASVCANYRVYDADAQNQRRSGAPAHACAEAGACGDVAMPSAFAAAVEHAAARARVAVPGAHRVLIVQVREGISLAPLHVVQSL